MNNTYVYDDGVVKGFIRIHRQEVEKLFVEPILHNRGIGSALLHFAIAEKPSIHYGLLKEMQKPSLFYQKHGFYTTSKRNPEEDTCEHLIQLKK